MRAVAVTANAIRHTGDSRFFVICMAEVKMWRYWQWHQGLPVAALGRDVDVGGSHTGMLPADTSLDASFRLVHAA